jgi:hypothetical protein
MQSIQNRRRFLTTLSSAGAAGLIGVSDALAQQAPPETTIIRLARYALQTLKEIPYAKWRDYNAEDAIRYYALRLHEAGMIKSVPNKIIAQGADWRLFNELKRELKG